MDMHFFKYILIAMVVGMTACDNYESEYMFEESPEKRMEQLIQDYTELLTAPEDGWIGYYTSVRDVGGFTVLLKFGDDGNVQIKNEEVDFANIPSEEERIPWRLGVSQFPELVFESACVFTRWHGLVFDTPRGRLMKGGEFQFFVEQATDDLVVLRSKTDKTDITRLYLHKARKIDWDLRGLKEFAEKLIDLEIKSIVVNRKLVSPEAEKYVEFNGRQRFLIVEGGEGQAGLYRFAISRTKIIMLDTIRLGNQKISEFLYDERERTIKSGGAVPAVMKTVEVGQPDFIHPQFLTELVASNPAVLSGPLWVWVKNPELKNVEKLEVMLKDYDDFYGLEFLPNLKSLNILGIWNTDSKIDLSKNKKLRRMKLMFNKKLTLIKFDHLEELEELDITANSMLRNVDLRTSCKSLKTLYAHMCHPEDFTLNLSGASKLVDLRAQSNGWKNLDITGCVSLETLLISSGGRTEEGGEDDPSISFLTDITGLDASVQKNLSQLFIPRSAVCGGNILRFYRECQAGYRNLLMMFGHALITPEKNPENIYNGNSCSGD